MRPLAQLTLGWLLVSQGIANACNGVRCLTSTNIDLGNVKPSTKYYVRTVIKLENTSSPVGNSVEMIVIFHGGRYSQHRVALLQFQRDCYGFIEVGGDFVTLSATTRAEITYSIGNRAASYKAALMYLQEIPVSANWREEADKRIDKLRKRNIHFKLEYDESSATENLTLSIRQLRQSFPFGGATGAPSLFMDREFDIKYREFFFGLFNWATIGNDMKWRFTEGTEGKPNLETVEKDLKGLLNYNVTNVRGHCMVWGKSNKILSWLSEKSGPEVQAAVDRRVNYVMDKFKGKFVHWDVNNENLHFHWYEEKIGDDSFTPKLFMKMHKRDPTTVLFLNDYNVISNGIYASGYEHQIKSYIQQGIPLGGAGIQSHLSSGFDADRFKSRLDHLGALGVPLWITEFDNKDGDLGKRAKVYADALRLYYSHPSVKGIIIWDGSTLHDGDFKLNKAGETVKHLIRNEWWTEETIPLEDEISPNLTVRAFCGTFYVELTGPAGPVWNSTFELPRNEDAYITIKF